LLLWWLFGWRQRLPSQRQRKEQAAQGANYRGSQDNWTVHDFSPDFSMLMGAVDRPCLSKNAS